MADILYKDESYKIIGSCMKVHAELGAGFLESVYQEALKLQFEEESIPFKSQAPIEVYYGKNKLNTKFIADFFCYDDIILEIKAVSTILPEHEAQIINYLKATNVRLGILVNFGSMSLTHKRYLNI